jgi:hypothetical protein
MLPVLKRLLSEDIDMCYVLICVGMSSLYVADEYGNCRRKMVVSKVFKNVKLNEIS